MAPPSEVTKPGSGPMTCVAPLCAEWPDPVVEVCDRRARLGLISAVTLIRFLERLIQDARRKLFLILDRLQVHRAGRRPATGSRRTGPGSKCSTCRHTVRSSIRTRA
jgi:hypothetical protein